MGSASTLTEELTVGSLKYWFALASSLEDLEPLGDQTLNMLGLEKPLHTVFLELHLVPRQTLLLHFLPSLFPPSVKDLVAPLKLLASPRSHDTGH